MNRIKGLQCFTKLSKSPGETSRYRTSLYSVGNKHQNVLDAGKVPFSSLQPQRRGVAATFFLQARSGFGDVDPSEKLILARNMLWGFKRPFCFDGNLLWQKQYATNFSRRYGQGVQNGPNLNRDFLVQLWVADKKMRRLRKRRQKIVRDTYHGETVFGNQPSFQLPVGRWFSGTSVTDGKTNDHVNPVLKRPPPSQSVTGILEPASSEEAQVAPLLARSNLLITRDIEWANLTLGFEQENRYVVIDACYPLSPVGFIREQSNVIARQLLRLRRPFVASIIDALGNELFRVRRPFWWITSSIYAEINGKEVGVVHRRWHLWKRVYDLYLGNKQFAVVENPGFWNWTFTLKNIDGKVLAQIDRDWRGFGFEIFTDAGQYVIRFGSADPISDSGPARVIQELEVARSLTLSERAVTVALAVSLDNDYFSRHGGCLLMEMPANENSEHSTISSDVADHNHDDFVPGLSNHGGVESKHEIAEEDVRSILEVIAATGKYWHDWEKLKTMLSFHLNQVLSEYPEAKMTIDEQNSSLGETYQELVKRLDDALHNFVEGPPFTLQRLCEILLAARSIYPSLGKLALALEKNLLVTSTLIICTDPYPPAMVQTPTEPDKEAEEPRLQSNSVQNGVEPAVGDGDEIMAEVEADIDDDMTIDMETFEEIVRSSETNSMPTGNS